MRASFERPVPKQQIKLQLYDDDTLSKKDAGEARGQNHSQWMAEICNVSPDFENRFPSSLMS